MKKNKIAVIGLSGESNFYRIEKFGQIGETILSQSYHQEYGGKGFNQAIAVKRMGVDVAFLSVVGTDEIAQKVKRALEAEGINPYLIKKEGCSASAAIIIDQCGNNEVFCAPGISSSLEVADLKVFEKEIKEAKILLLQLELNDEVLKEAIRIAKDNDTLVILNPAPAHKLDKCLIDACDIIIPNEIERAALEEELNNYQGILITTLGSKGCRIDSKDLNKAYQAFKVKAINTTGAGDVFCGSFAAAYLLYDDLEKAIQYATVASAISVEKDFVIDSIPTLKEVDLRLKS